MRKVVLKRVSAETKISLSFNLDGKGKHSIKTGIDFLDHMIAQLARHGMFDINLRAVGDLNVDLHHTNEDVGIVLGKGISKALGNKANIERFGYAYSILDESLSRVVVDVCGRSFVDITSARRRIRGENYSFDYFEQFMRAFSANAGISIHIDILKGNDFHHMLESSFKALALALRMACKYNKKRKIPSTKGRIDS